jgi:NAD(P)-dependent dehydrogenase (short-subunit alcohol dehydrogenase family)
LTKGLALELAPCKIRVNAIAPGHTETEGNIAGAFDGGAGALLASKTQLGRLGRVNEIAPLAVFLASDESAWITGEVIRAAGGIVVPPEPDALSARFRSDALSGNNLPWGRSLFGAAGAALD